MEPEKKSNGALIGLIIIIIILIVGGLYMWQKNKNVVNETNTQAETVTPEDSAELDTLNQELDTTDIDVGANAINSIQ
ncbi:hypothetical protein A3B85_02005 [Candidatus Nomurabacteria bacterium RIFCSPHIGHO2_02_FULL_37_13]|uniref:Uncharacterized protein n=1 Tax=Candidatus Nomurabacteria bacterium RIFCSPHIGHO2_02_FULL_37_13 TaxID=1801750 RepID=A0A1F6W5A8_9BACT|nr:MAG: hypothetical protein A2640_00775 [Candidatus Nomurabacteria bacterium RIFCSPHIGHO2_01_FULL_36_23]OGI76865.1 MAG: hypothetical protein A3B85_02005 [Candidatus Nomurabacteria bacterium RIFCSPHIGHO2_02_FULL_37_13]OGI87836.1 MAG: hypothetical protein A2906_02280 [Candidatus Nomurabacteria bacterium RIFCSPLOWO2_01_FULL_37_25]